MNQPSPLGCISMLLDVSRHQMTVIAHILNEGAILLLDAAAQVEGLHTVLRQIHPKDAGIITTQATKQLVLCTPLIRQS